MRFALAVATGIINAGGCIKTHQSQMQGSMLVGSRVAQQRGIIDMAHGNQGIKPQTPNRQYLAADHTGILSNLCR